MLGNTIFFGDGACRTTNMEGSHGQLRTGLSDGLGGDDTYRLTDIRRSVCSQVPAVTLYTVSVLSFTCKHGSNPDAFDAEFFDFEGNLICNLLVHIYKEISGNRMLHLFKCKATHDAIGQGLDYFLTVLQGYNIDTVDGTAVVHIYYDILGNVHESTGEVSGICRLECRIRQSFTGTVGGYEKLDNRQTLFEV